MLNFNSDLFENILLPIFWQSKEAKSKRIFWMSSTLINLLKDALLITLKLQYLSPQKARFYKIVNTNFNPISLLNSFLQSFQ